MTSKTTSVTLNKLTGQITTTNDALASGASVSFTLNNTLIGLTDFPSVVIGSGATSGAYAAFVSTVGSGSCTVSIRNISGGSLSEAITLNFMLFKGANS